MFGSTRRSMKRLRMFAILLVLALVVAAYGRHAGASSRIRPAEAVTFVEVTWILLKSALFARPQSAPAGSQSHWAEAMSTALEIEPPVMRCIDGQ
jgi:hypothetical protein